MRTRRRTLRVFFGAVSALLLVGLLSGAGLIIYVHTVDRTLSRNLHRLADQPADIWPAPSRSGAVNYVIMGSDSRVPGRADLGRSDVLMVLHVSSERRQATLISFARDLYVPIPGHGRNKINAAFALGGPSLTRQTLEQLLGVRMDHLAVIDFDGFVDLTEIIGGVRVHNRLYSRTDGYEFPVGEITVSGEQALAYVRERKQLPRGDLDRIERQQDVVAAIMAKGLSPGLMADPATFNRFVARAAADVTVDDGLSVGDLRDTVLSVRFSPEKMAMIQAPLAGFATTSAGQNVAVVDKQKLDQLRTALRDDAMGSYVKRYPDG